MQKTTRVMLLGTLLTLQGCASLSEEECAQGDWQGIGYRDGSQGYGESRIEDHLQACREYRVTPDVGLYRQGRQRGLEEVYCLPGSGYRQGMSGADYRDVCPAGMNVAFTAAYRYGEEIYRLQQEVDALDGEIGQCDARIEEIERDSHRIHRQLRTGDRLTEEKRRQLRRELRLAERERLDELQLRKRLHRQLLRMKERVWERKVRSPYQ